ncbi:hypothetical protein TELCIR_12226, partial [Teladorsagia circumcincta]
MCKRGLAPPNPECVENIPSHLQDVIVEAVNSRKDEYNKPASGVPFGKVLLAAKMIGCALSLTTRDKVKHQVTLNCKVDAMYVIILVIL